jgi:hypothetical protein
VAGGVLLPGLEVQQDGSSRGVPVVWAFAWQIEVPREFQSMIGVR